MFGAFNPVFDVYKTRISAPTNPNKIPADLISLIFSFNKMAEKIKTMIGEIVIITELFTGVDNSRPLKKASIFITIPKKEHAINLGQSFLSILSCLTKMLAIQKRIAAPKTLSNINPKGLM